MVSVIKKLRSILAFAFVFGCAHASTAQGVLQAYQIFGNPLSTVHEPIGIDIDSTLKLTAGSPGTLGIDLGNANTWTAQQIVKGTTSTYLTPWLTSGFFVSGTHGTSNDIVGFVDNDLAASTTAFPTAVTGVCYSENAGNTCFSMYGEEHALAAGVVTTELSAFNDSGVAAPTTYPWSRAIGTTSVLPIALTLSADSCVTCVLEPAAAALEIGSGGVSGGQFQFGIALQKTSVAQYSYFQDADATHGPTNGIYMAIPGSGINAILKTMGTEAPTNTVLSVQDSGSVEHFNIKQNGTINSIAGTRSASFGMSDGFNDIINSAGGGEIYLQIGGATKVDISLNGVSFSEPITETTTTASTSTTTGAIIDDGGLGVAGSEFIGGALTIGAGSALTSSGPGGALASGAFAASYTLPNATTSTLGGVKCDGATTVCSSGVISAVTQVRKAVIQDQEPSGTAGNAVTTTAVVRLNTLSDPYSLVSSLSANQFTLPAGTYEIHFSAPFVATSGASHFQAFLENVTGSTTAGLGSTAVVPTTALLTQSEGDAIITLAGSTVLELEVTASAAGTVGIPASLGGTEVYGQVVITKMQ